jgi:hypothetical protein
MFEKILKLFKNERNLSPFFKTGFHGDRYLTKIIFSCLKKSEQFIETGCNVGSSLVYVLKNYPELKTYSCEPDKDAYEFAKKKIKGYKNAQLFKELSPDMLYRITKKDEKILEKTTVFWLVAHEYGYKWPLKDEIKFISENFKNGYIFIDDFKIPGKEMFNYSAYDNQICSFEYIKDAINQNKKYNLFYPSYTDKTSKHHPLIGWGLIYFGFENEFELPNNLKNKMIKTSIK